MAGKNNCVMAGKGWRGNKAGRDWRENKAGRDWRENKAGRDWRETGGGKGLARNEWREGVGGKRVARKYISAWAMQLRPTRDRSSTFRPRLDQKVYFGQVLTEN